MPYICRTSFAAPDNRIVVQGQEVADDDPIVKGREGLFSFTEQHLPTGPIGFTASGPVYGPDRDEEPEPAVRRRSPGKRPTQ